MPPGNTGKVLLDWILAQTVLRRTEPPGAIRLHLALATARAQGIPLGKIYSANCARQDLTEAGVNMGAFDRLITRKLIDQELVEVLGSDYEAEFNLPRPQTFTVNSRIIMLPDQYQRMRAVAQEEQKQERDARVRRLAERLVLEQHADEVKLTYVRLRAGTLPDELVKES